MVQDRSEPSPSYPTTRWSLVARAGGEDPAGAREALSELLRRYLPALHAHLVVDRRIDPDRADDVLQGFVCGKVVEEDLMARADRVRGKFRTFILTALDHYLVSQVRREHAKKRSPARAVDYPCDRVASADEPSHAFDLAWAREVIARAIQRMQEECEASCRADVWGVFESRVLQPTLTGSEPMPYDALVARYGLKSPAQASNVLITGKRMFARVLRSVVREYAGDEEVETEIDDLKAILFSTGA